MFTNGPTRLENQSRSADQIFAEKGLQCVVCGSSKSRRESDPVDVYGNNGCYSFSYMERQSKIFIVPTIENGEELCIRVCFNFSLCFPCKIGTTNNHRNGSSDI